MHVTSHRFDDPRCVSLVASHRFVVAIHGCKGDSCHVFVGGRDKRLAEEICSALRKAGLRAATSGHKYLGTDRTNICNRGIAGKGVQLELTLGLRRRRARRLAVVNAVRDVLLSQKAA